MKMQTSMQNTFPREQIIISRTPTQLLTYKPAINQDFVERLLGRRQKCNLPRTTQKRLTIQHNRLQELINPRVTWKEFSIAQIEKTGVTLDSGTSFKSRKMSRAFQGATSVVGFIATIGQRIDREIESLMNGGALAHGYVADSLGSGAVESLADRFHNDVAKEVGRQDHSVGLRFSPGYCDWPVTEQQKLFSLLDNKAVGVKLSNTSLMTPRKSISALFGIFETKDGLPKNSKHNPCRRCGKKDCIARRVEAVPPLH
ncbi:MAG: vitamin B12 dependent-methionine synthase activation domain-containing protein [Thermodesulfobacteriota bacterium]|nr:vitamin B12 dependent-methionine synthase activation domain-containing protein [Thermodesulfobacteriota bacterium]